MIILVVLVVFYLLVPLFLIYLCKISSFLQRIGAVVLAYAVGIIAGNIGLIPSPGIAFRKLLMSNAYLPKQEILHQIETGQLTQHDYLINQVLNMQDIITSITILIAIPLLLFSLDILKWLKLAKGALLSLTLAVVSLIAAIFIGFFLFHEGIDHIALAENPEGIAQSGNVAGMLVGVYTGGTVNLAAIGNALNVDNSIYIFTHTSDLIIGTIALLFLMTVAQRLFHTFLPKFGMVHKAENLMQLQEENNDMENFDKLFQKKGIPDMLKALGIAMVILPIGIGIGLLFNPDIQTMVTVLTITTLGLVASLNKRINKLRNSFQLGMYLIIVFSLVVSSMANLSNMISDFESVKYIFYYVAFVVFGSMIIHVGLSRIFKVDADTTIIAIAALTYSPPFVPTVASAIKNKDVIISGLTIGILGYAFGTYLGVVIGGLLGPG